MVVPGKRTVLSVEPCLCETALTCPLLQVRAIEWPYEDTGDHGGRGRHVQQRTIADYLADNKFDLVINLPMRNGGTRAASSFTTQGYKTRRMAVDYSVPLITDIKCVKLLVEVSEERDMWRDSQLNMCAYMNQKTAAPLLSNR
jgi:hypothetical protein